MAEGEREKCGGAVAAMMGGVDSDSDPVMPVVVNSPGAGGGGRRLLLPT